jgi:hypothetical protein
MEPDGRNRWQVGEGRNGSRTRNPLPCVAAACRGNAIVRKGRVGFQSVRRALRVGDRRLRPGCGRLGQSSAGRPEWTRRGRRRGAHQTHAYVCGCSSRCPPVPRSRRSSEARAWDPCGWRIHAKAMVSRLSLEAQLDLFAPVSTTSLSAGPSPPTLGRRVAVEPVALPRVRPGDAAGRPGGHLRRVFAVAVFEYVETPPALNARTRYE